MTVRKRFIALEGGDGVGKSSVVRALGGLDNLTILDRKIFAVGGDLSQAVMGGLRRILWESPEGRDFSSDVWMHLQIAWHTGLFEGTVKATLESGKDVLIDGWIWKFAAKLMVQGYTIDKVFRALEGMPTPDAVILLVVDAQGRSLRRSEWSMTERGLHAGFDVNDPRAFVQYQDAVDSNLLSLGRVLGWRVIECSELSFEEITNKVAEEIYDLTN